MLRLPFRIILYRSETLKIRAKFLMDPKCPQYKENSNFLHHFVFFYLYIYFFLIEQSYSTKMVFRYLFYIHDIKFCLYQFSYLLIYLKYELVVSFKKYIFEVFPFISRDYRRQIFYLSFSNSSQLSRFFIYPQDYHIVQRFISIF